jgi:hypothetical protein
MVYAADPRLDLPSELGAHLALTIAGRDPGVVAGWLRGG